jgi:predicted nucleic acid-binding protein
MKKLYLDVCTICRPFDDQNQIRVRMETSAFYLILSHVHKGLYQLNISPVHYREVASISDSFEKIQVETLLRTYDQDHFYDLPVVLQRAEELIRRGLGIADATHLAMAEQCSDIFITCDDKLLKKAAKLRLKVSVTDPLTFCIKENLK